MGRRFQVTVPHACPKCGRDVLSRTATGECYFGCAPIIPCIRCDGPIDDDVRELTRKLQRKQGKPETRPKLCSGCMYAALHGEERKAPTMTSAEWEATVRRIVYSK